MNGARRHRRCRPRPNAVPGMGPSPTNRRTVSSHGQLDSDDFGPRKTSAFRTLFPRHVRSRGGGSRGRLDGGKYSFIDPVAPVEDEAVLSSLYDYYGIAPDFPLRSQLVMRSLDRQPKRLYFVARSVLDLLMQDSREVLKVVSTGLKVGGGRVGAAGFCRLLGGCGSGGRASRGNGGSGGDHVAGPFDGATELTAGNEGLAGGSAGLGAQPSTAGCLLSVITISSLRNINSCQHRL
jgi:hypothetical protein